MTYTKTIVCLANSYKPPGGRCVAGKEVLEGGYGSWIRPVSDRPKAELSLPEYRYVGGGIPKLLDFIEVSFSGAAPHDHQTENQVIDAGRRWAKRGECSWDDLDLLCDRPEALWINSDSTNMGQYDCMSPEEARTLDSSLLLIRNEKLTVKVERNYFNQKLVCRGEFSYRDTIYNFSLTDPDFRDIFKRKGEGEYGLDDTYTCLSLTQPYEEDGRCHKLVAAVITRQTFE